tara:strand:+ start:55 stop:294 length:240 start_codon:yes stop_codon:yes gene_type:complete
MRQIDIFVQSIKRNKSDSLINDSLKLKYTLPENCFVKDLINTINQFKNPKNHIRQLINSGGIFNPNEKLEQGSTYYYFF